ncbi:MAG: LamG-like jellyroll fold domain-containing protein, partial [Verrucomicrobiales bacterium]
MKIKRSILASAMMASGLIAPATYGEVSPYSWIRSGEFGVMTDSSGKNHPFNAAFSSIGGGNPAVTLSPNAAGGPLGKTGAVSSTSTFWGHLDLNNSGMWVQSASGGVPTPELWSLPAKDWIVEAWVLPVDDGASGGSSTSQFLSTGSGHFGGTPGGVAFRTEYNFDDDTVTIRLFSIGTGAAQIGDDIKHDKKKWMHLAAVNDNGVTTLYVNGVPHGEPSTTVSAPSGVPYIGSGPDTGSPFKGYLDEIRFSTFEPGKFEVADLLLRPAGPGFISQPQSASVWNGGAAPFIVSTVFDDSTTYQWQKGGVNITGATGAEHLIPTVTMADNGTVYKAVVTTEGGSATTSEATLTVVANETENNNFYRAAITAESSLLAYFPVDGSVGETVANEEDENATGALQGSTSYDGRTDRSYGERALRFTGNGDVAIAPNEAFEFADGTGTIEALVYMARPLVDGPQTIFSVASDATMVYYALQVSQDGTALSLVSDAATAGVSWASPTPLLNRFAHVALVFNGTKVTAYVDGVSLGQKDTPALGLTTGLQANIGSTGPGNRVWNGTIDELAIYGDALSDNTIAIHNSRFVYGTAVTAPAITTAPTGSWNLLAGGAPIFRVAASGTAPLAYQWKLNGAPIQNNPTANTATLTVLNSTVASSGNYSVTVSNPIGEVTSETFSVTFSAPDANDKYAALVLADGPTAYWRLNETTGNKLTDYAGGFDGTYSAAVQQGVEGAPGTAPDKASSFSGAADPVANATVPYTP